MSVLQSFHASQRLSSACSASLLRRPLHKCSTWHRLPFLRVPLWSLAVRPVQNLRLLRAAAPAAEAPPPSAEQPLELSFESLGVEKRLLDGLTALRVTKPAPIQLTAVPRLLLGINCAIQSYTGSGKTIAYLLPALSRAIQKQESSSGDIKKAVQVLVIAPSQELCIQIANVAKALLPVDARAGVQQCIGGANMTRQIDALKMHKPMLVVGTPGRLATLGRMGKLGLHHCGILIVDEVDQLLSADFSEDMQWLTDHAGRAVPQRQSVMVSATLTRSMLAKAARWCPKPEYLNVGTAPAVPEPTAAQAEATRVREAAAEGAEVKPGEAKPVYGWGVSGWEGPRSALLPKTEASAGGVEGSELVPTLPPNLRHYMVVTSGGRKVDMLRRCMYALDVKRALVFMNFQQRLQDTMFKLQARKMEVNGVMYNGMVNLQETMFKLQARKMEVGILHGDLDKLQRAQVLAQFRRGDFRAMIVSDVVARGLDVPDCDAVFHLELPSSAAHYAHRAGRTGRMGAPGTVVVLTEPGERWVVEKLGKKLSVPILEAFVSNGALQLGPAPIRDHTPRSRTEDEEAGRGDRKRPQEQDDEDAEPSSAASAGRKRRAVSEHDVEELSTAAAGTARRTGGVPGRGGRRTVDPESPAAKPDDGRRGRASSEGGEEDDQAAEPRSRPPASSAAKPSAADAEEWYEGEPDTARARTGNAAAPRAERPPRAKKGNKDEWFGEEEDSGVSRRPSAAAAAARQPAGASSSGRLGALAPQQRQKIEKILRSAKVDLSELADGDEEKRDRAREEREAAVPAAAAAKGKGPRTAGGKASKERAGAAAAAAAALSPLEALQAELEEIKAEKKSKKSSSRGG